MFCYVLFKSKYKENMQGKRKKKHKTRNIIYSQNFWQTSKVEFIFMVTF